MTDPVAEAAAQIAAQQAEPSLLEKAIDTIHDLEAKVEHLIHPEVANDAAATTPVAAGGAESAAIAPVAAEGAVPVLEPVPNVPATVEASATVGVSGDAAGEQQPGSTGTSNQSEAMPAQPTTGELPNAASGAAEPTTAPASASSAAGVGTASRSAVNSAEPLHHRVALHLEAIYAMVKEHVESAPAAAVADTSELKTHVGDILHRLSNGMQVSEGAMVQKLEKLYQML